MTLRDAPLWTPSKVQVDAAPLTAFARAAAVKTGTPFLSYRELHRWSVDDREAFWSLVWDFCDVIGDKGTNAFGSILVDGDKMPGAKFFPNASLNFAENLLRKTGADPAIVFRGEDKVEKRLSWDDLHALTSRLQQLFLSLGVKAGDRIAALMPNMPETVAAMLAAASIGAVWSSCSPDFGVQGTADRFAQIEPVIFITCDGYWYNGKTFDVAEKIMALAGRLATVRKILIVDYLGTSETLATTIDKGESLAAALSTFTAKRVTFKRLAFSHPLYILFSSGTTGIPKCIVHSAGGTLITHLKEQRLHAGLLDGDRLFHFTTCGWMMWNWLVSGLASGATLLLYDGSPFYPDGNVLFDFAEKEKMTYFGTSAKFISSVRKACLRPIESHDLSCLRTISSTGSPLSAEDFRFVYEGIRRDVHLASISGGTDIASCFVLGVPTLPVWAGEIQGIGLGLAVDIWDADGKRTRQGKGELVCSKAFPAMPIGFWNDPDGKKYHAAYFERFGNVWCHGDFVERTIRDGLIIHGRSDATLNPGGVRIGTAEIYSHVEQMPEILEALCIGQDLNDDVRIVLFVRLAANVRLNAELEKRIRTQIRSGASPRHVPTKIIAVADIPRTKSGKIAELAVRDVVHGRAVQNKDALANPKSLLLFADLPELAAE